MHGTASHTPRCLPFFKEPFSKVSSASHRSGRTRPHLKILMEHLVDFLNHGILPFTGRRDEVEGIMRFWRGTFAAQELRALLIVGEAGIGKSRLITESTSAIAEAGGTVIHTKLYPESTTSIVALIAQELWYEDGLRRLLKSEPDATVPGVAAALRRIARLRPTLLIIEDVHLLAGDALREFSLLAAALADETISMLCAARPVELPARPLLERFLVEEMVVSGISREEIDEMWTKLLSDAPDPDITAPLADLTGGNPLALRSALRAAIRSETLVHDAGTDTWHVTVTNTAFDRMLRRNVGMMAEGMVLHLTDAERQAAQAIAMLGEVFARESADAMIDDAAGMIGVLMFKGIIATASTTVPPLPGLPSHSPLLSFTHTLLHQHLLAAEPDNVLRLATVTGAGLPLYSIVPLRVLYSHAHMLTLQPQELVSLVQRLSGLAVHVGSSMHWHAAGSVLETVSLLVERHRQLLEDNQRDEMDALLLFMELNLRTQSVETLEFRALVDRLHVLTSNPATPAMANFHLWALRFLLANLSRRNYDALPEVWEQVDALLVAYPMLRNQASYITLLRDAAQAALRVPDLVMLSRIELRLEELLAWEEFSESMRDDAVELVATQFLQVFNTQEELSRRMRVLENLPRSAFDRDPALLLRKMELLVYTGRVDDVLAIPSSTWLSYLDRRMIRSAFQFSLLRICAEAATGAPLEFIERKVHETVREIRLRTPEDAEGPAAMFLRNAAIHLSAVGALRGDLAWSMGIMQRLAPGEPCYWPELEVMLAAGTDRLADVARGISEDEEVHVALKCLALAAAGDNGTSPEDTAHAARTLLGHRMLELDDLLMLHAAATLVHACNEAGQQLPQEMEHELAQRLQTAMEWLAERSLAAYMEPMLERYGRYFSRKELARWRGESRDMGRRRNMQAIEPGAGGRIRIRMIGTIAMAGADGEYQPLRGSRIRTMLGLLVAARMLPEPLSNQEFCRIAASGEMDIDLARKTMNMAVVRLRETIGAEMVITGETTHELNLEHVQVDLLEAHALLAEAVEALRNRAPMRAHPALLKALELANGEVPFPGLYDDFFEALRSDFESLLRESIISLARFLLREHDPESAERLLRHGFQAMPEDEELAELLQQALTDLGRHVDARRIRMRAEETV